NVYVFARQDNSETVVVGINRQDKPAEVTIPFKSLTFLLGEVRADTFASKVTLPPNTAVAFQTSCTFRPPVEACFIRRRCRVASVSAILGQRRTSSPIFW